MTAHIQSISETTGRHWKCHSLSGWNVEYVLLCFFITLCSSNQELHVDCKVSVSCFCQHQVAFKDTSHQKHFMINLNELFQLKLKDTKHYAEKREVWDPCFLCATIFQKQQKLSVVFLNFGVTPAKTYCAVSKGYVQLLSHTMLRLFRHRENNDNSPQSA